MNNRLKNLNLEEVVLSLSPFFQDMELLELLSNPTNKNLSYKMRLDQKDCVLKVYDHRDKRRILQDIQLQTFLYNCDFPCQKIIALEGNQLLENKGAYYSLSEFIHGESIPVKAITADYAFQILDVLKLFYMLSKEYSGDIDKKSPRIPPVEIGPYRTKFEEILKKYKSIVEPMNGMDILIHGDFQFDHVLQSPEGEIFLLDFESVKMGNPLEDLANFIFYSHCTGRNQSLSPRELFNYFIGKDNSRVRDIKNLEDYVRSVSLIYGLRSIWEFNRGSIDGRELTKRLKAINRADNLQL